MYVVRASDSVMSFMLSIHVRAERGFIFFIWHYYIVFIFWILFFYKDSFAVGTPCLLDRIFYFINCEPQRLCVLLNHLNYGLRYQIFYLLNNINMKSPLVMQSLTFIHEMEKWGLSIEHLLLEMCRKEYQNYWTQHSNLVSIIVSIFSDKFSGRYRIYATRMAHYKHVFGMLTKDR